MGFFDKWKSEKAPPPPDPYAVANAQTGSNVDSAVANSVIQNANERNPYGGVTYRQTGGTMVGGKFVPQYTRTQTESPAQRRLRRQQERLGVRMNDIAGRQITRVDQTLSAPIDRASLPAAGNLAGPEKLSELSGKDYSADRL